MLVWVVVEVHHHGPWRLAGGTGQVVRTVGPARVHACMHTASVSTRHQQVRGHDPIQGSRKREREREIVQPLSGSRGRDQQGTRLKCRDQ